jgi:NADH-quinone oxidoreductase subunit C
MAIPNALNPVEAVKAAFPDAFIEAQEFRGQTKIILKPESIVDVCRYLRDTPGLVYNFLTSIDDVDYYPDTDKPGRFALSYQLLSMLYKRRVTLKVYLPEENPSVKTVTTVWPSANWLEREIHDLMGIEFEGHPDPRRIQMPEDWIGHPHRRDYPLGYETVMFSFNAEEIMRHKPKSHEVKTQEEPE